MFVLVVAILTSVYAIVSNDVFSLTATLFSSVITLPVPSSNNSDNNYNDLPVALNIKPNACNLGDYNPDAYSLPI